MFHVLDFIKYIFAHTDTRTILRQPPNRKFGTVISPNTGCSRPSVKKAKVRRYRRTPQAVTPGTPATPTTFAIADNNSFVRLIESPTGLTPFTPKGVEVKTTHTENSVARGTTAECEVVYDFVTEFAPETTGQMDYRPSKPCSVETSILAADESLFSVATLSINVNTVGSVASPSLIRQFSLYRTRSRQLESTKLRYTIALQLYKSLVAESGSPSHPAGSRLTEKLCAILGGGRGSLEKLEATLDARAQLMEELRCTWRISFNLENRIVRPEQLTRQPVVCGDVGQDDVSFLHLPSSPLPPKTPTSIKGGFHPQDPCSSAFDDFPEGSRETLFLKSCLLLLLTLLAADRYSSREGDSVQKSNEELMSQNSRLTQALDEKEEQLTSKTIDTMLLKRSLDCATMEISHKNDEAEAAYRMVDKLQTQLSLLSSKLSTVTQHAHKEKKTLTNDLYNAKDELIELRSDRAELDQLIQSMRFSLTESQERALQLRHQLAEERLLTLNNGTRSTIEWRDDVEASIRDNGLETSTAERDAMAARLRMHGSDDAPIQHHSGDYVLGEIHSDTVTANSNFCELENSTEQLRAACSVLKEEKAATLAELDTLKSHSSQVTEEHGRLSAQVSLLKSEIVRLTEQLSTSSEKCALLQADTDAEFEMLQAESNKLRDENSNIRMQLNALEIELSSTRTNLQSETQKSHQLAEKLNDQLRALQINEHAHETTDTKLDNISRVIATQQGMTESLEKRALTAHQCERCGSTRKEPAASLVEIDTGPQPQEHDELTLARKEIIRLQVELLDTQVKLEEIEHRCAPLQAKIQVKTQKLQSLSEVYHAQQRVLIQSQRLEQKLLHFTEETIQEVTCTLSASVSPSKDSFGNLSVHLGIQALDLSGMSNRFAPRYGDVTLATTLLSLEKRRNKLQKWKKQRYERLSTNPFASPKVNKRDNGSSIPDTPTVISDLASAKNLLQDGILSPDHRTSKDACCLAVLRHRRVISSLEAQLCALQDALQSSNESREATEKLLANLQEKRDDSVGTLVHQSTVMGELEERLHHDDLVSEQNVLYLEEASKNTLDEAENQDNPPSHSVDDSKLAAGRIIEHFLRDRNKQTQARLFHKWACHGATMKAVDKQTHLAVQLAEQLESTRVKIRLLKKLLKKNRRGRESGLESINEACEGYETT